MDDAPLAHGAASSTRIGIGVELMNFPKDILTIGALHGS
jgi:hypothetical protein